jgi:hypothetical protein
MARLANIELQLMPGALTDDTDLAAQLRTIAMDKTRWRGNRPQTIGGWLEFDEQGMTAGTARGIHTYADLEGAPIVVAASESAVNAWVGATTTFTRQDITPAYWVDVWIDKSALSLSSGVVTMTWLAYSPATDTAVAVPHFLEVGDQITISNFALASGTAVYNATHTITSIVSPTKFTFSLGGTGSVGSIAFRVTVPFKSGLVNGIGGEFASLPRSASIDNFGENAVFCFSDGSPVFMWSPRAEVTELLANGTFSGSITGWTQTPSATWQHSSNVARYVGDTTGGDLKQDISADVEAGQIYQMSFQIVTFDSGISVFRVLIDDIDIFPPTLSLSSGAGMARTYTFRFTCPSDPHFLIFRADAASTNHVEIDNVSLTAVTEAVPISEAPQKNLSLFVDGNRILNVLGSIEADGDFDARLLRWCDQDNIREWVPNTDNVAGEFPLGKGSYAICGAQVGERNLILTDTTAFSAAFNNSGYSIRQVGTGCGAMGVNDLAVYNNRAFWASKNAFYSYDGTQIQTIECPVKEQFVAHLAQFQESKTFAWINSEFSEVWFHYPHADDGLEISRYLIFNFIEQGNPWSFGTFDRTCMASAGIIKDPIGIDLSRNIWRHERGTAMPGNITLPFLETGYLVGQGGDRWLGCRRYYPDVENQTGNIKFTVSGKRAPQGQNNEQTVGPLLLIPDENKLDFVLSCRQLKFRWESEATPTWWRLGVVGLEMKADKERR